MAVPSGTELTDHPNGWLVRESFQRKDAKAQRNSSLASLRLCVEINCYVLRLTTTFVA